MQWWLTKAAVLLDLEEYLLRRPPAPFRNQVGHLAVPPNHVIASKGSGLTVHPRHQACLVALNACSECLDCAGWAETGNGACCKRMGRAGRPWQ